MHADGAGTKSSLAYLYWKETGDISVWAGIAQDAIVMNTDDLMCVGATDNMLLSSTIGRNKNLIPGEVISAIINGTEDFLATLRSHGIGIYLTGGETADVGDLVRTVIVDSTVTTRMRRDEVINNHIQVGDVIVGFASYGKASYEIHITAVWEAMASHLPDMICFLIVIPMIIKKAMTTAYLKTWSIPDRPD